MTDEELLKLKLLYANSKTVFGLQINSVIDALTKARAKVKELEKVAERRLDGWQTTATMDRMMWMDLKEKVVAILQEIDKEACKTDVIGQGPEAEEVARPLDNEFVAMECRRAVDLLRGKT